MVQKLPPNSSFDGRQLLSGLPLILGPLLDGARIGSFGVAFVNRSIGTGDTVLPHKLGRVPNGLLVYRASAGSVIDASTGVVGWTNDSITLRSTTGGTYSGILV